MTKFYEDLKVCQKFISPGRTITETDVINFACSTADWTPIHTNKEYCKNHPVFSSIVVQGLLVLSIVEGLKLRIPYFYDINYLASLRWEWDFKKPVYPDDTVHIEVIIENKRVTSSGRNGIVYEKIVVINQKKEIVQQGIHLVLIGLKNN